MCVCVREKESPSVRVRHVRCRLRDCHSNSWSVYCVVSLLFSWLVGSLESRSVATVGKRRDSVSVIVVGAIVV